MPKMVGEDTSQTLTNKTVSGTNNTITNAAPAVHTHTESDVTSLTTDLAGKASATHTHAQSDITNLTTDLAAKVPTTRTVNGHALSSNVTVTANDVLPTQTGNSGKFLKTDGTNSSWATAGGGSNYGLLYVTSINAMNIFNY